MNTEEGGALIRDGLAEMAVYAPEPEPSLWRRLMRWFMRPICNL